jgi:histidinol-phosphate aminotransferase
MSITHLARPDIVAMKPYSSARSEAEATGTLLNANELPWPLITDPASNVPDTSSLNRYPEPQHAGLISLLAGEYGLPAEKVLLTRGSDDGIDLLVRVFCRAGEDSILDCPPSFGMYKVAARAQGAGIITAPRVPGSLELDTRAVLAAVGGDSPPRLVFLTSPANPTGDLVEPEFLEELLRQARERSIVVVDEAYAEFTSAGSFAALIGTHENLVVLRTLSKGFASAALRCGAVLAQPEIISLLRRVIPPYPLATPVIELATRLFDPEVRDLQASLLREVATNKAVLVECLEQQPFVRKIWRGEANFVLARVDDARDLVEHCSRNEITIRMFDGNPMLENCVRISVGTKSEMALLRDTLRAYQPASAQTQGRA